MRLRQQCLAHHGQSGFLYKYSLERQLDPSQTPRLTQTVDLSSHRVLVCFGDSSHEELNYHSSESQTQDRGLTQHTSPSTRFSLGPSLAPILQSEFVLFGFRAAHVSADQIPYRSVCGRPNHGSSECFGPGQSTGRLRPWTHLRRPHQFNS